MENAASLTKSSAAVIIGYGVTGVDFYSAGLGFDEVGSSESERQSRVKNLNKFIVRWSGF